MKVPGPDLTASPQFPAPSYLAFAYSFDCGSWQAVGGTLHNVLNGDLDVEFADSLLNNRQLLRRVAARNREITGQRRRRPRTYLLPQVITTINRIYRMTKHRAWAPRCDALDDLDSAGPSWFSWRPGETWFKSPALNVSVSIVLSFKISSWSVDRAEK